MKYNTLKIIPLGGLGEIGRNMTVYEYEGKILIVDAGIMFPRNSMHGIDYIIPDMQYIIQRKQDVVGIVFTHGHEDHIGAITHLIGEIPVPIYATGLTRGLIEIKLAKKGLLENAEIYQIEAGERILIGPFQIDFFHVCHSIPDGVGLGIETPAGLVVHTGDYKFDQTPVDNWPTDFGSLAALAKRGVSVLLSDSTNAEHPGWTPSEREIDEALDKVFLNAKGRIIIASFASLISRMQQVADAAKKHGRRLAFAGTSMLDNSAMALEHGYLHIEKKVQIPLHNALTMKDDQIVIMCTGSQGEPTSILGRLALGQNRQFDIKPGDTVVLSSHTIPGNEESVYNTINQLFELGADVIYEGISSVHVSGHASQEEMKLLINLLKPKYLVPIHGELRHLKAQARIGKMLGIPEDRIFITQNGGVLEFEEGELTESRPEPYSYVFVDGHTVGDVGEDIVRERNSLGRDGVVMLHLVINQQGKFLKTANDGNKNVINGFRRKGFSIQSFGFLNEEESDDLLKGIHLKVLDYLSGINKVPKDVERAVMKLTRNFIFDRLKRRPRIIVAVQVIKGQ